MFRRCSAALLRGGIHGNTDLMLRAFLLRGKNKNQPRITPTGTTIEPASGHELLTGSVARRSVVYRRLPYYSAPASGSQLSYGLSDNHP